MSKSPPRVIVNCLLTMNNVQYQWEESDTLMVSYPIDKPSDIKRVELRFAKPTGVWRLYACSENLHDGAWERMQEYLIDNQ